MNSETDLPSDWERVSLEQIAEVIPGNSPPSSTYNEEGEGLPFYQGKTEFGDLYPEPEKWCTDPKKVAEEGDVLVSVRAPVGPTNLCPDRSCIGRGLAAVRPKPGIQSRYILWAIRAFENDLARQGTGTTFDSISSGDLREFEIPLAPSSQRESIVAKIEELFSNLDAGMADLQAAGQKLERYRMSVLQAAVEGRLTADWRRTHDPEPADQLLERILEKRQEQWEERYRWERYDSKGKEPPSGWKDRYSEPEPYENDESLPELPSSWEWTNLDHFTTKGPQNGLYLPKKKYGSGTPILRIDDFQNGWSRKSEELQKVDAEDDDIEKYSLKERDLVINRVNSITHLGKCLFVEDRNLPSLFESNMMRLHLTSLCQGKFVEYYLRSPLGRQTLIQNAKHAVNQASINQGDVKEAAVPLPPIAEQKKIVDEVERLLSVADDAAATTDREHTRAERLRQSILKQAFSGQLVPHDEDADPPVVESGSSNGTAPRSSEGTASSSSDADDVMAEELYNGGDPGKQIEMDLQ